ncbi:ChbG/HpnK family deacetylase [uncultured Cohaesibacter sp.]|uniref:ChbG/HpnK family deacetylase n=1 Tax=uncultured Cohaesibacter sp. TaxID=1002546 RepID=UPI00292ED7DF|nr:ChbG/HpnK family deacetylase [uncultured Cohaesibacter sp.]
MLCALDYSLAHGVDDAIIDLTQRGIVGAISCLSISDLWPQSAKRFLRETDKMRVQPRIGLSLTLSGSFSPLSAGFAPENREEEGKLPRQEDLAFAANRLALDVGLLEAEFRAQLRRYSAHLGKMPDFVTLQASMLSLGPVARAVTQSLSALKLPQSVLLCPLPNKPSSLHQRIWQKLVWKSTESQRQPWNRRVLMDATGPDRLPPKSSWRQDGKIWTAIYPAHLDERLVRFDGDLNRRQNQFSWFDQTTNTP